jgi:hypothetical protein
MLLYVKADYQVTVEMQARKKNRKKEKLTGKL